MDFVAVVASGGTAGMLEDESLLSKAIYVAFICNGNVANDFLTLN